jgi:hypothetical protein
MPAKAVGVDRRDADQKRERDRPDGNAADQLSEKRNFRPSRPLMAAPIRGSRGTSQMYLYIESFQKFQVFHLVLCTSALSEPFLT